MNLWGQRRCWGRGRDWDHPGGVGIGITAEGYSCGITPVEYSSGIGIAPVGELLWDPNSFGITSKTQGCQENTDIPGEHRYPRKNPEIPGEHRDPRKNTDIIPGEHRDPRRTRFSPAARAQQNSPDHALEEVVDDEVGLGDHDQQRDVGPAELQESTAPTLVNFLVSHLLISTGAGPGLLGWALLAPSSRSASHC